jgi:hypothetical protein
MLGGEAMNVRATYVLATIALLATAIAAAIAGAQHGPVAAVVALVAALVALLLIRHEWRRDRQAAAMFVLFFSASGLCICGAIVAFFPGSWWGLAGALGAGALVITGALARVLWREHRFADEREEWTSRFAAGPVFEDDGVQWQLVVDGADLSRGVGLTLYLQNNVEASREVTLRFRDESGLLGRAGTVAVPELASVMLPAGGHARAQVTVVASGEKKVSDVRLYTLVDAEGAPAPRNRRRRGQPGPRPTPRWLTVLAPIAGMVIVNRGGVVARLHASGGPARALTDARVSHEHELAPAEGDPPA